MRPPCSPPDGRSSSASEIGGRAARVRTGHAARSAGHADTSRVGAAGLQSQSPRRGSSLCREAGRARRFRSDAHAANWPIRRRRRRLEARREAAGTGIAGGGSRAEADGGSHADSRRAGADVFRAVALCRRGRAVRQSACRRWKIRKDFGLTDDERRKVIGDDGLTYELIGATFLEAESSRGRRASAFDKLNDFAPNAGDSVAQPRPRRGKIEPSGRSPEQARGLFQVASGRLSLGVARIAQDGSRRFQAGRPARAATRKASRGDARLAGLELLSGGAISPGAAKLAEARPLYEAVLKKGADGRGLSSASRNLSQNRRARGSLEAARRCGREERFVRRAATRKPKRSSPTTSLAARLFQIARDKHGKAAADDARRSAARPRWPPSGSNSTSPRSSTSWPQGPSRGRRRKCSVLGLRIVPGREETPRRPRSSAGASNEAKLPDDKPSFEFYLAGALEMDGQDRRGGRRGPQDARHEEAEGRAAMPLGSPGSSSTPSATRRPTRPTRTCSPSTTTIIPPRRIA